MTKLKQSFSIDSELIDWIEEKAEKWGVKKSFIANIAIKKLRDNSEEIDKILKTRNSWRNF
jgi:hypothetical protein